MPEKKKVVIVDDRYQEGYTDGCKDNQLVLRDRVAESAMNAILSAHAQRMTDVPEVIRAAFRFADEFLITRKIPDRDGNDPAQQASRLI